MKRYARTFTYQLVEDAHGEICLWTDVKPLLDRLAEAEKPRTRLTKERFYELWAQEGAMGPLSAKRCWDEIESHAVIPEGYFRGGEDCEAYAITARKWMAAEIVARNSSYAWIVPEGVRRIVKKQRPLTNSEKITKLLPEVDVEKREAMLKYFTQEHLDVLCAEHGIALEMEEEGESCEWRYDEDDGSWDGSCGAKWRLEDAGPEGHGMKFCPCCGKSLVEIRNEKEKT